jgi:pimeloyl-ACP methyl ester carboxylesterase
MHLHSLSYPPKAPSPGLEKPRQILIFFISGNPGLIDYYEPFLSTLRELLDSSSSLEHTQFHIYGQDLAGFDDNDHEPFSSQHKPHTLEDQIQNNLKTLQNLRIQSGAREGDFYDQVLLMGHSVGSYMALELCHRVLQDPELAPRLRLGSGILLFPTIEHIARSAAGTRLDLLRRIPVLGPNAYLLARGFLALWPRAALDWFLGTVMGFPAHAAAVTARWLKSRDGVWQALYMGMDEMQVIGEDRWDDELWGIAREADAHHKLPPKFYFYFGRDDHWVANHYRDAFIAKRQGQVERTRLVVDEGSIPHAFCIRESSLLCLFPQLGRPGGLPC